MATNKYVRRCKIHVVWLMVLLLLTGCWSNHEINNLAPVNVLGVDRNNNGELVLTAHIPKPSVLYSQTSNGGGPTQDQEEPSLVVSTSGRSLFEAMGKLSDAVSEPIYLGHVNTLVFGEQAARYDMESSLDFFSRENDFRPNMKLLITKGQAQSILKALPMLNKTLGLDVQNLIRNNQFTSTGMVNDLSQFIRIFDSDTQDPVSGEISFAESENIEFQKSTSQNRQDGNHSKTSNMGQESQDTNQFLALNGTAAFKGEGLVGWLNNRESRGLLWLLGDADKEIVVLNCGKNGTVSLKVNQSSARMIPEIKDGKPEMTVDVQVGSNIGQVTCSNFNIDTKQFDQLQHQFANQVQQDVHQVIKKAKQQWETDIFGFGREINKKYPKEWGEISPQWREGGLKNMPLKIKVTADITRYGLIKQPRDANEPVKEEEN